jgi:ABC-type transporter Mla subunit MlaD
VRFSVGDGATGLERGSRVLVGGQPVGAVDGLEFQFDSEGRATFVDVDVRVIRRIRFRQGSIAYLVSPLLGGSGIINFRSTGDGAELGPTDIIEGRISPPTMLAQAGYGEEQKAQVQNIIRNINEASEKINTFMDDARVVSTDVRAKWPDWSARLDSITKNTDEMMAKGPGIAASIEERLEKLKEIVALAKDYLTENRQNVKDGIQSFRNIGAEGETFMARLNGELSDKAAGFLDAGKATLADGRAAIESVRSILDTETPNIRRIMANFRLASDQLTATTGEIRRSPWRLLYRPDTRELDYELLYDSARAYAAAISDLRSASETLKSVGGAGGDAAKAGALVEELDRAFGRYRDAEAEFLRQLSARGEAGK